MLKSKDDKYTNHQANIPLAFLSPLRNVIANESALIRNFRARSMCSNFPSPKMTANSSPLWAGYCR